MLMSFNSHPKTGEDKKQLAPDHGEEKVEAVIPPNALG